MDDAWGQRTAEPQRGPAHGQYASAAAVLALLYCVGGLACLAGAAFPVSEHAPVGLAQLLGVLELGIGAVLITLRHRVGARVLQLSVLIRIAIASVLVSYVASAAGVALIGLSYVGIAVFACYFFSRPAARVHGALAIAGCSAGMLVGGIGDLIVVWFGVAAAVVIAVEVLGRLIAQLRSQAASDSLTGLANRASFRLAAQREIAMAARGRVPLSLVLLDLDDFKAVNDTRGHLAGDALLVELARAWQRQLRGTDLLARYGGDEFALLLPATTAAAAALVLERLRAAHPTSWSVGVADWTPGADLDHLLEHADLELYRAKDHRARSAKAAVLPVMRTASG